MTARTRVAVVGYGRFGRLQAAIVENHPVATLVAVMDPVADALRHAASAHPEARLCNELSQLLNDQPDAILITSPEDTHASIARVALERGIHVMSEKPLALSFAESRELVELSKLRNVVYQAGYILRYEPRHVFLREQTRAFEAFGPVCVIRAKRDVSRSWFHAYGTRTHPVYETLVHDIDLAVWLTGERCQRVTAWDRSFFEQSVPDTFVMVLEFASGAIAVLQTMWLVPDGAPANILGWEGNGVIDANLEVVGARSTATLRTYEPSLTLTTPEGAFVPDTAFWPVIGDRVGGALRDEIWDFLDRVQGGPGRGLASIDDALQVQAIAEASVEAAESGAAVEIPSGD